MGVSIVATVLNEEELIASFLESLLSQSKKTSEIVVVDGGSTDKTSELIRFYQLKHPVIKFYTKKGSRTIGRNFAVDKARSSIIAFTDAGCVADKSWLEKITAPLKDKSVDIVAGFYEMVGDNSLHKSMAPFLGKMPDQFNDKFMPSTRSIAFRKRAWKKLGGFQGGETNTAEDTIFNYNAVKSGLKIVKAKDAIVYWQMPKTIGEFFKKISSYAEWDAESRIFWHPVQKMSTHNIKVLLVFLRYFLGFGLVLATLDDPTYWNIVNTLLLLYFFWSFFKVYTYARSIETGLWGIVLQITADIAVMTGFLKGILNPGFKKEVL